VAHLRRSAMLALAGALVAGGFGVIHDQITFTLSPEYFTRMKFEQFRAADLGFPPRVFVAEIGFLATWWVGLIATWFLARIALKKGTRPGRRVAGAIGSILAITTLFGIVGYFAGPALLAERPGWQDSLESMGVTDITSFQRVAGIHLASYVGAALGWIAMLASFLRSSP
jgi:hypothetical protein